MTQTERTTVTCANRDAFLKHVEDHGTALLKRAAANAIAFTLKGRRRNMVSADQLVGEIFGKTLRYLEQGNLIRNLEAFAWQTAAYAVADTWRQIMREDTKVDAFAAETELAEWRSPERCIVAKDLLVKLVRGLSAAERAVLVDGIRNDSGLSPAQRQRLSRARRRAKELLADLKGEAGNCLSDLPGILYAVQSAPGIILSISAMICRRSALRARCCAIQSEAAAT